MSNTTDTTELSYNLNHGKLSSLSKAVEESGIRYSTMNSKIDRFSGKSLNAQSTANIRRQKGLENIQETKGKSSKKLLKSASLSALMDKRKLNSRGNLSTAPRFQPDRNEEELAALGPGKYDVDNYSIGIKLGETLELTRQRDMLNAKHLLDEKFARSPILGVAEHCCTKNHVRPSTEPTNRQQTRGIAFSKIKRFQDKIDPAKLLSATDQSFRLDQLSWVSNGGKIENVSSTMGTFI